MGYTEYEPLAGKYGVPIVVTGFEPLDVLQGVYMCVGQLEEGRGIGEIAHSGLGLRERDAKFDAEQRFDIAEHSPQESSLCLSGLILQGIKKPPECPAFATRCTPERPLGASMISAEGACAAYYRYRRL